MDPYYGFVDYNVAIKSRTQYGCCLRQQVNSSTNLELLNLEEIFNVFVPSTLITNPLEIKYKDTINDSICDSLSSDSKTDHRAFINSEIIFIIQLSLQL